MLAIDSIDQPRPAHICATIPASATLLSRADINALDRIIDIIRSPSNGRYTSSAPRAASMELPR